MNQRIDELRTSLRDDPGSRLFFQLGDLLRKAGEVYEAETILRSGLEHHPRYVAAWVSLGRIQLEQAQFSEAERSFARALELDPENAVAARLIGETAEKAGEWVRAIKAYKLARALTPGDAELETRIEAIEQRLSGESDDAAPEPMGEPFQAVSPGYTEVQPLTPPEPLPVVEPAPDTPEPFDHAVSPGRPREVVLLSAADPFATTSTGDTGVWMAADDVFAPPEPTFEPAVEDVFGGDRTDEVSTISPEDASEPIEEQAAEAFPKLVPESEPIPELEPEPEPVQELSLPTVTLARLALEQDDRPLAQVTLKAILDRDPDHREAAELLESLSEDLPPEISEPAFAEPSVSSADLLTAKSKALKGWMENIRAAAERRAP